MKIPRDDPRARHMSGDRSIDGEQLADFVGAKHRWVLATTRTDGRPQMSPVSGGLMADGRLAVATYPERVKARNARRNPAVSVLVLGAEFDDEWVQIDGEAEVLDLPAAADAFVEYYRCIAGEHPDWAEYRQAMIDQGKCLIAIRPTRWGPVSWGGFPPSLFEE